MGRPRHGAEMDGFGLAARHFSCTVREISLEENSPVKRNQISLRPLQKALSSLERAVAQPKDEFSRDSVIQRFEYTFELCWKTLQKVLESDRPLADPSVRGILREAARLSFVTDLDLWYRFHESRNLTSHTYNEETAEEVFSVAVRLPAEARKLLVRLEPKP